MSLAREMGLTASDVDDDRCRVCDREDDWFRCPWCQRQSCAHGVGRIRDEGTYVRCSNSRCEGEVRL